VENPGDGEGMRVGRRKIRKKGSRLRKKMVKEGKQARISRYRWTAKIASVPIGAGTKSILLIIRLIFLFPCAYDFSVALQKNLGVDRAGAAG
jgi:hypothetical protein